MRSISSTSDPGVPLRADGCEGSGRCSVVLCLGEAVSSDESCPGDALKSAPVQTDTSWERDRKVEVLH